MGLLDWLQDPRRTQAMQGIGSAIQSGLLNIQQGNERFQGLASRALADPTNPAKVTDPQAFNELSKMAMGLLSFAPVGMTKNVEYKGSHTAPNAKTYGATLDDLTKIMPADVYGSQGKQLYGIGDPLIDSQWRIAALKAKGKPDAEIEVYRAVPKGIKEINSGDWVTTSPAYAKWHGENVLDGEYEIIKQKVKAKTLSTEGYPYEFGYNPFD